MKTKQGYKKQKTQTSTGKWLKRYFLKRTSRKDKPIEKNATTKF